MAPLPPQISDLRSRGDHLQEDNVLLSQENVLLSQENVQNSADVEEISQQLAELIQENERREAAPAKEVRLSVIKVAVWRGARWLTSRLCCGRWLTSRLCWGKWLTSQLG